MKRLVFSASWFLIVALSAHNAVCQENKTRFGESPIESKSNPPCATPSSPCPLDFAPLPDVLLGRLAEAKRSFDNHNFAEARMNLEGILQAQPDNKIILYDLALTCLKQEQREKALSYQQRALQRVTHPYQRKVLDQLEQEIRYGRGAKNKVSLSFEEVTALPGSSNLDRKGPMLHLSRNPVERNDAEIKTVCSELTGRVQKEPEVAESPDGVFDLAQCAEYEGRLEESARLYNKYLAMEPEALDRDSVALRLLEIEPFKDSDPSSQPRRTYQTGITGIMTGAFNVAALAFRELSGNSPQGRVGLLEAGILSLLAGQRGESRRYLENLLAQEANTDMRDYIGHVLRNEEAENNEFVAGLNEVQTFTQNSDFVQAAAAIEKPLSIYPLSPAANVLAAFIALNTNDYPAARRSMDILSYQGLPVSFYAAVKSPNQKDEPLDRVQIFPDKVTLVDAQVDDMTDLLKAMSEDRPSTASPTNPRQITEFQKSGITGVRSTGSALVVETPAGKWKIFPQVDFHRPREGWPARAFMNDYADLFSSYLGLKSVQLGAESTNASDRWRLTGKIFLVALEAYAQSRGSSGSNLHGALKTISNATATSSAALAAMNRYNLYKATMNNTLNRFLFRPLVPSEGVPAFMAPPRSDFPNSTADFAVTTQVGNEPLIQYEQSKTKRDKARSGFVTLLLNTKDEVGLQDTSGSTTMKVPCSVLVDSLSTTETHKEVRNGRERQTESPSPWTISSFYRLTVQKAAKNTPEIGLVFGSALRRARVRGLLESHCNAGIPETVSVYVPLSSGQQWRALFHGKMHLGDRRVEPFPSCANIKSLRIVMKADLQQTVTPADLEVETIDKQRIHLGKSDLATSMRIGSNLSHTCAIPLRQ